MAIILAVLGTVLLSALGGALVMTTTTEAQVANNFRWAGESLFAADVVLERSLVDVRSQPDWAAVTNGSLASTFVDGAPSGTRVLADGSTLDVGQLANLLNCRKAAACSSGDLAAVTAERPWGASNPVWRPYAYGPLSHLAAGGAIESAFYVLALVADDPARDPDVLWLRVEAFGPRGARRAIESVISRGGGSGFHVVSWRPAP